MKYKTGSMVYVSGGCSPGVGKVITNNGMGPYCIVVQQVDSKWIYAFNMRGTEIQYQDAKLMPLTKLHKILLGIK